MKRKTCLLVRDTREVERRVPGSQKEKLRRNAKHFEKNMRFQSAAAMEIQKFQLKMKLEIDSIISNFQSEFAALLVIYIRIGLRAFQQRFDALFPAPITSNENIENEFLRKVRVTRAVQRRPTGAQRENFETLRRGASEYFLFSSLTALG